MIASRYYQIVPLPFAWALFKRVKQIISCPPVLRFPMTYSELSIFKNDLGTAL